MKKTIKIFALIIAIIMLFTTFSFADEVEIIKDDAPSATIEGEEVKESSEDVPMVISTKDGEDIALPDDDIEISTIGADEDSSYKTNVGDFFSANDVVNINKYFISGNAFVAGGTLTLQDVDIDGNLFIAGESITLKNVYVYGSIFIAGKNIIIDSSSTREIYGAGESISLESAYIQRSLNNVAQTIDIKGSQVDGNSNFACQALTTNESYFYGDLNYSSTQEAKMDSATVVEGNVHFDKQEEKQDNKATENVGSMYYFMQCITAIVVVAVMGAIFIWGPKKYYEMAKNEKLAISMLKSFGIGFLAIIVVPIAFILLLLTVVGLPIAFALLLIYFLLFIIASASMTCFVMFNVLRNKYPSLDASEDKLKMFAILLFAGACVWLAQALPIIGGIVGLVFVLSGYGSLIRCLYLNIDKLKAKNSGSVEPKTEVKEPEEKAEVVVEKEEKDSDKKDDNKKDSKKDN